MQGVSRRGFLAAASSAAAAAELMQASPPQPQSAAGADTVEVASARMIATFHRPSGMLYGIRIPNDPLRTNFLGNPENWRGIAATDERLTGNVISTVWDQKNYGPAQIDLGQRFQPSGAWKRESTGASSDIRKVAFEGNKVRADYTGRSASGAGIQSYRLATEFAFDADGALLWTVRLTNPGEHPLEIGELAFPLLANDDYAGLYRDITPDEAQAKNQTPIKQRLIHEQRVFAHHFVGGHSSYSVVQRPMGDARLLLVHPTGDTAFECCYKAAEGNADVLAVHSWATKNLRRWANPWVNGHTSLILKPGETRTYGLRFQFIDGYPAIREELARAGNLGIRVVPSMVVQENMPVYVEFKTQSAIDDIHAISDGVAISGRKDGTGQSLVTFSFQGRGQKSIQVRYGGGKWTNLHFYCTEDIGSLLKARGKFIITRQFLEDPKDPYHRNHMFMPFDYANESMIRDSDEVWEAGGSDEFGFSEPLFLAEKNVYYPSRDEIEKLETYVDDCLFRYVQNPQTYEVRASLFWKDRYPSSPWGHWTEERSEKTWRTYNYVHPANIYHGLYTIGKRYGLLTRRTAPEYLRMAYRTCMQWLTAGPWKYVGLMCGSNAVNILEDLKRESWNQEYTSLRAEMEKCNRVFGEDPYPYSSELVIDQTAHEQVYFFTRYFGNIEKQMKTAKVIQALRGGNQPVWFRYGNDKRGDMACWYSESLNGWPLLDAFEQTGDPDMFLKGYAGVMSVTANLRPDGMGFGWYISSPGVTAFSPPRTLDNGIGQYGFFKAAKSYVLRDPAFGLIGAGCRVTAQGDRITVEPKDGLKKRIYFASEKLGVSAAEGEVRQLVFDRAAGRLELRMADSTGFAKQAQVEVSGLDGKEYEIRGGSVAIRRTAVNGRLTFALPIAQAASITIARI